MHLSLADPVGNPFITNVIFASFSKCMGGDAEFALMNQCLDM